MILDTAILGGLAFVMSTAARLKPHAEAIEVRAARIALVAQRAPHSRTQPSSELEFAPVQA